MSLQAAEANAVAAATSQASPPQEAAGNMMDGVHAAAPTNNGLGGGPLLGGEDAFTSTAGLNVPVTRAKKVSSCWWSPGTRLLWGQSTDGRCGQEELRLWSASVWQL